MPCSSPVSKRLDEPLKHNIIDKRPSSRRSRLFSASASASDRFTGLANSADSGLPARPRLIQFRRLPSETPNRFAAAPTPTDSANRIASTLNSSVYFRYRTGPLVHFEISTFEPPIRESSDFKFPRLLFGCGASTLVKQPAPLRRAITYS